MQILHWREIIRKQCAYLPHKPGQKQSRFRKIKPKNAKLHDVIIGSGSDGSLPDLLDWRAELNKMSLITYTLMEIRDTESESHGFINHKWNK